MNGTVKQQNGKLVRKMKVVIVKLPCQCVKPTLVEAPKQLLDGK